MASPKALDIRIDALTDPRTLALIDLHLSGMRAGTPAESVHAIGADDLRSPGTTLWSAWERGEVVGIGALRDLGDDRGELKSFRTAPGHTGRGVARAVLRTITASAAARGFASLWLETGADEAFAPARALYASEGFRECAPFGGYLPDPLSVFMTRRLSRIGQAR